jgi:putative nucleotidyltransferase with HDIG domain
VRKCETAPYDIRSKDGRLLIGKGVKLSATARNQLKNQGGWYIDAKPPFPVDNAALKPYVRDYERMLRRFSDIYKQANMGKLPIGSLKLLVDCVIKNNQSLPLYAMTGSLHGFECFTPSHSLNVAAICAVLGCALKLSEFERRELILAGLLHDIGKSQVPVKILLAKRKLTPYEFTIVQKHPDTGADIAAKHYDSNIVDAVRYHHVKAESGYPYDVEYGSLPDMAKWIGTVDSYESLTADRPYRQKTDPFKALRILCEEGVANSDFHFIQSFSEIFSKLYTGCVVTLSNGNFGVIRAVTEQNGVYTPLVEMSCGNVLAPSDDVEVRDFIGIAQT